MCVCLKQPELNLEDMFVQLLPHDLNRIAERKAMSSSSVYSYTRSSSGFQSKLQALKQDLAALHVKDPHMHVVIFTNQSSSQENIVHMLKAQTYTVHQFGNHMSMSKRHNCIRKFQSFEKKGPTIIVTTIAIGNVGITLTAATRVYLMEPNGESEEIQAAGRIHRIGQTKKVLVKRLVYRGTGEELMAHRRKLQKEGKTVSLHKPNVFFEKRLPANCASQLCQPNVPATFAQHFIQ